MNQIKKIIPIVHLLRRPDPHGVAVISITKGKVSCLYTIMEIPCFIGGRGFAVHRTGMGNLYHVRVGKPIDCTCECNGFLYRNTCRHIQSLSALIRAKKL